MEAAAPTQPLKVNRFLPYLAVFQADLKQTLLSWIYRAWVLLSVGASLVFLLYRFGAKQVGGFVQPAPEMMSVILTSGTICAERGNLADSILSRGISRHQYFLGKWTARLAAILGTFLVMSTLTLFG